MDSRIAFNAFLKTLTPNVYFQPGTNISLAYPAIVYTRRDINKLKANNSAYAKFASYSVTVIDRNPDSTIAQALLDLRYSEYDRQFVKDGLNHINLLIYY